MRIKENKKEKYIYNLDEIAQNIYNKAIDMDFQDYEEEKEKEVKEIENALYYIKSCAQNEYNADYFRTFYNAILTMFENE